MPLVSANIDEIIESYDAQDDAALSQYFAPIENQLWQQIENYGAGINDYGTIVAQHLKRTSAIGMQFLTTELGFSEKAGRNFYDANLLQDLGKIHTAYDVGIWSLPHRPSQAERDDKRLHTSRGAAMIDTAIENLPDDIRKHPHIHVIKAIQLYHHERIDGTGQHVLSGDKLGQVIKAICIIDAFDGDMIYRPHQLNQRTPNEALKRLQEGDKYQGAFDQEMLMRFVAFQTAEG